MKKKKPLSRKRPPPGRAKSLRKARRVTGKRTSVRLDKRFKNAIIQLAERFQRDNEPSKQYVLDTYADDPIPENAIGFYDAFYRTWALAEKDTLALDQDDREKIRACAESSLKQFVGDYSQEDVDDIALGKEVNLFFRECITEGQLVACVRDPETGDILQLQRNGWGIEFYPEDCGFVLYNHVHPDDPLNPGPADVIVRGKARPVFFLKDQFERWLQKTFGARNRRGRKQGSGSYEKADQPLLQEMKQRIDSGRSRESAALQVAHLAVGGGTLQSKASRLSRRYRRQYLSEHN
jgi:hypothetical protein